MGHDESWRFQMSPAKRKGGRLPVDSGHASGAVQASNAGADSASGGIDSAPAGADSGLTTPINSAPAAPGQKLAAKLALVPARPGVYLLKDGRGRILYIGKAKRLPARLRSYFQESRVVDARIDSLIERVRDFDYIVTASEAEALVLEANLVKSHAPRFNIELKDDKKYPFVKVSVGHPYPRIEITRRVVADGSRYFGPFVRVKELRKLMRSLRRLFPIRSCTDRRLKTRERECLDYFIDLCPAPCTGRAAAEAYAQTVESLVEFLAGRGDRVIRRFEDRMRELARELRFEESARLRDDLARIRDLAQAQQMTDIERPDLDAVGLAVRGKRAAATIFSHRGGRVAGTWRMPIGRAEMAAESDIMAQVLIRHYQGREQIPPLVLVSDEPRDQEVIEDWLTRRAGRHVRILRPQRGPHARLVASAYENAALLAEETALLEEGRSTRSAASVYELQQALGLPNPPYRIEGYDISNVQGRMATGSLVLFMDGSARKGGYRRYRIREVPGADDYAMLAEVLRRRLARLRIADEQRPDLILIDGGLGQVSRVSEVMRREGFEDLPVIGLAKREEEIWRPGKHEPLRLPRNSSALHLLQRVRDEAHRFAVSYHRHLRSRALRSTPLDRVSGLGPKKRAALLAHFGSYAAVARANEQELCAAPGIGPDLARRIREALQTVESKQ